MVIQKIDIKLSVISFSVAIFVLTMVAVSAEADVNQIKLYKKAFPGAKPKCLFCHVNKIPKKADGEHDLNAYGLKVKSIAAVPTEEAYKEAGSAEDFKMPAEESKEENIETMDEKKEMKVEEKGKKTENMMKEEETEKE